jgi:hypothetical protein
MKLKDTVYKIYNNRPTKFIIVSIVNVGSIFPFGKTKVEYGICTMEDYEKELERSGTSRSGRGLPYVQFFEERELFETKELLLNSFL